MVVVREHIAGMPLNGNKVRINQMKIARTRQE